jgi:hypothetical protein
MIKQAPTSLVDLFKILGAQTGDAFPAVAYLIEDATHGLVAEVRIHQDLEDDIPNLLGVVITTRSFHYAFRYLI